MNGGVFVIVYLTTYGMQALHCYAIVNKHSIDEL